MISQPSVRPLAALLLACACGGADANDADLVERVDSAGVEVVRNLAPERPLAWRFEKVLTLGGVDEGPQAFAGIGPESVGVDDAGRIYVSDRQNYRVRVFDDAGTQIREMGGRGAGPGEFEFPASFAVSGDGGVRIADFSKQGLVAFGPAGEILPHMPLNGFPGTRLRFVDGALATVVQPPTTAADDSTRNHLIVMEPGDTMVIAREAKQLDPEFKQLPRCPIGLRVPPLLAPTLEWDARGDRVAVTDDEHYSVDFWRRDEAGSWTLFRRVSRALPPLAATVEIAAAEYPDSFRIRGGSASCAIGPIEVAEALGFAEFAPHVKDLALGPDGTLWIRHRTGDEDVTRIDVFDAEGTYLGTLPPDSPFPSAFRGTDEILTVEQDELDRPLVVVWRIMRG